MQAQIIGCLVQAQFPTFYSFVIYILNNFVEYASRLFDIAVIKKIR